MVGLACRNLEALSPQTLLRAEDRPALVPGQPCVWALALPGQNPRPAARAQLRQLLAGYLGIDPDQLALSLEPGRAPRLEQRWRGQSLFLSLSYARDAALLALCPGLPIGVDLTEIQPMPDCTAVAGLYLGPRAATRLAMPVGPERDAAFAREWAALEARGKCLGLGLAEWSAARAHQLDERAFALAATDWQAGGRRYAIALARPR